jgi:hypothetical protein
VFFRSAKEVLRLATLEQRAGLLVLVLVLVLPALALLVLPALALALVLLLVAPVLLLLPQPARNAAAATHATASPLHRLAIMPAECRIRVLTASPAPGEGQRPLNLSAIPFPYSPLAGNWSLIAGELPVDVRKYMAHYHRMAPVLAGPPDGRPNQREDEETSCGLISWV